LTFPGYTPRPHQRHGARFVPEEKRRRIQYDTDKRREEQGKKVIHLHEKAPPRKMWPSTEYMEHLILAYFQKNGSVPAQLVIPFRSEAPKMAYVVRGLPPSLEWDLSNGSGRLVEMDLIYDPDASGVALV
jgi:hypothetical protein